MPPPVGSGDSVLDGFAVDSAASYAPATHFVTSESTESVIHAPAPQHIHSLARTAPVPSLMASRFLHSAPVSEVAHEGVDRGCSTAPSTLDAGLAGYSSPSISSPQPHHLREPHKSKRAKRHHAAHQRSPLANAASAPPRQFLVPKKSIDNRPPPPSDVAVEDHKEPTTKPATLSLGACGNHDAPSYTRSPDVEQCSNPFASSIPPPVDSADSVLDDFVVNSASSYAAARQAPDLWDDDHIIEYRRKSCNYFVNIFKDLGRYEDFLEDRGEHAQNVVDEMQSLLDCGFVEQQIKVIFVVALSRLSRKADLYPKRYTLHDVSRQNGMFAAGHFGDIEKGCFDGKDVCIKIPRSRMHEYPDLRSFRRALSREIVPWAQVCHENVLPFYGIIRIGDDCERLGIVSPFLENGNIVDFLKKNPDADRPSLIFGIAAGMEHLHSNGLVHGDIKGSNILVTNSVPPRACLADFGFTIVTDSDNNGLRSSTLSSGPAEGGTIQFQAPELWNPDDVYRRTKATDVYAFSMASYEILTGNVPFPKKHNTQVMVMVGKGKRPSRPEEKIYKHRGLNDDLWKLLEKSWAGNPGARPTACRIVERLLKKSNINPLVIGQGWGDLSPSWFPEHRAHQPGAVIPEDV
ncbi:hypothetical protein DXG01_001972 [Tephrocybe rancida]|nr:hypothetical protein DXG01_001972 [Tephrocybe rancida]